MKRLWAEGFVFLYEPTFQPQMLHAASSLFTMSKLFSPQFIGGITRRTYLTRTCLICYLSGPLLETKTETTFGIS